MAKEPKIISLGALETCVRQTISRVNQTRVPVFVAVRGEPGVAILDMNEYRELERLADIGLMVELQSQIARDEAEGALVPWEIVNDEWKRKIEAWKREEDG
jgi:hypothetical protein